MTTDSTEVLIVGAGPAGLSAALVLGRQQRRVTVVDAGHPRNAPVQQMHMVLSRDGANPAEFGQQARAEIGQHTNVTMIKGQVDQLVAEDGQLVATITNDRASSRLGARKALLATGMRDELSELPGLRERWGRQVTHCPYCHGFESLGKTVAVLANESADAMMARYVADRFSKKVTLYTGALPDPGQAASSVANTNITVEASPVVGLTGADEITLELADGTAHQAEVVFHRPPAVQASTLAADLGCELTTSGLIAVDPMMATSVPGVYAAGDGALASGLQQPTQFVSSAAADGQRAAVWIESALFMATLPN